MCRVITHNPAIESMIVDSPNVRIIYINVALINNSITNVLILIIYAVPITLGLPTLTRTSTTLIDSVTISRQLTKAKTDVVRSYKYQFKEQSVYGH